MSENLELLRARIEYESNAREETDAFDEFTSTVTKNLKAIGEFETEVDSFSSALELAFERPKRPMREFFSAVTVGLSTFKQGAEGTSTGLATIANSLSNVVKRVPAFAGAAAVFDKVSAAASLAGNVFKNMQRHARGLAGHIQVLVRQTSDYAEELYSQVRALRIAHQVEVERLRDIVNWRKRAVSTTQNQISALDKEIQMKDRVNQLDIARLATMETDLGFRTRNLQVIEAEIEAMENRRDLAETEGERARLTDQIAKATLRYDKALADVNVRYQKQIELSAEIGMHDAKREEAIQRGVMLTSRLAKEEGALAKARDDYNRVQKVNTRILQEMAAATATARTAVRHLMTALEAGKKIPVQRLKDAQRAMRLFAQSTERANKAGMDVSATNQVYKDLAKNLATVEQETKKQAKATDVSAKSLKTYEKETKKATATNKQFVKQTATINRTMSMVSRSFSSVSPQISSVIYTVQRFNSVFTDAMRSAGTAAEVAAAKINAGMMLSKVALIGAGVAAIAFIKKTGLIAAEVTTLEITMRQVARNLALKAGADVQKFVDYVDKIPESLKGITTREALTATTSFLRGVPQLLGRIQELAEASKNFGVTVADMSSSEVFGRFNKFIQSGTSALLKRLNIVKTADQMHKEYAETIGKSVKDLSGAEKITARFEGILSEVALTAGVYEEAMESAGKQLSSMSRLAEEAALQLGKRFEPAISKVIFGVNKLLKWFTELPAPMHDFIANVIQATAVAGGLVGIITVAGPAIRVLIPLIKTLGFTIKAAVPWMLALGAAFSVIMLAIKAFRKVWDQNLGGIRDAIQKMVAAFKTGLAPIMEDIEYWIGLITNRFSQLVSLIVDRVVPVFMLLASQAGNLETTFGRAFALMSDVVNGFGRAVYQVATAVIALFSGDIPRAADLLEMAIVNVLTSIALLFKNTIAKAATWGWNLMVQFANGITLAASQVIAKVMNWVGNLIAGFWKSSSPPKKGPLRYINKWGRGIMETLLRSFGLADFGMLNDIMSPIKAAFETAVKAGTLGKDALTPLLKQARQNVAALISELDRTGTVGDVAFQGLVDTLGEGGQDIVQYVRLLIQARKATDDLKKAQDRLTEAQEAEVGLREEYEELVGTRAARRDIRGKREALLLAEQELAAAEEANEAAEEKSKEADTALAIQKEFLAAQQESIDLELEMAEILDKVADKLGSIASALGDAAEGAKLELAFPDIGDIEGIDLGLDVDKLKLGQVSKDFLDMRDRIQEVIDKVKAWFNLPWSGKLATIQGGFNTAVTAVATWVEGITGWDISTWAGTIETALAGAVENLEKLTGWDISTWLETTQGKIETAWNWIVEKAQWLYDELIGESIIPDLVSGINDEWDKLTFAEGVGKVIDWFVKKWEELGLAVDGAKETWGIVVAAVKPFFDLFSAPVTAAIEGFVSILETLEKEGPAIKEAFDELGPAFDDLGEALGELWIAVEPFATFLGILIASGALIILGQIVGALAGAIAGATELVKGVVGAIAGVIQIVTGFVGILSFFTRIFTGFFNLFTGRPEEAKESFLEAFRGIGPSLLTIWNGILGIILNIGIGIVNAIIATVATFTTVVANWIVDILESFGIIDEDTAELWRDMLTGVTDLKDDMIAKITEWKDDAIEQFQALSDLAGIIWAKLFDGETGTLVTVIKAATLAVTRVIIDFVDDLVGEEGFFNDVSKGINEIWTDIFGEEGWLIGLVNDAIAGILLLGQKFKDAGGALIGNLWSGMKEKWLNLKENVGKSFQWLIDQFPGSEPKDPASPFRDLEERGAAIWENVLSGMENVDVSGAVTTQMAGMVDRINASGPTTTNNNTTSAKQITIENLNLYGVQEPEDLMGKLQALSIPGGP